ncbi:MAG: hypothetical protein JWP91_2146 [Fibrobacteres bacterium]|nr:hypothetical protein [Fibrobacterota bacterium]
MKKIPTSALALALCLGASHAGRPANGYFYFTFSRDFSGDNIGKVDWNWDGRSHFFLGEPQTFPRVPTINSLVYTWDDHLLIAGKYENEVYKIKPGGKTFDTTKNTWKLPEHIFVEPGLKSAWVADNRGYLYHTPLDPYGKATEVRPTGSEKGVNTIAYKDAEQAWYSQSTLFDSSHIGELDPNTMATNRKLTIGTFVNDSHYDPFTGNVVFCGDKTLSQYDPATNAIVSKRVFGHVSQLYSCVVDGEGHMILSSWKGDIYFIDYSETGKVGDPANYTDSTFLVDGMFYITPLIGPGSPPIVHRPFYAGTHGVYHDSDGDGRIDGAVIEFKAAVYDPPALIRLRDPRDPAKSVLADSAHIVKRDFTHYLVDLRDRPFPFGTDVAPGAGARILQDSTLFGSGEIPISDEVGPQAIAAEARPPQARGDKPQLTVTFSEAMKVDLASKEFPFLIKRPNADVNGLIQVESVQDLGKGKYRYVFSSAEFPLLGDSLKLSPAAPQISDTAGNLNNMSIWIPVGGYPFPVFSILPEKLPSLVMYTMNSPVPAAPPVLVVDPGKSGSAVACLNCPDSRVEAALAGAVADPASRGFEPWLLTVNIQGPVRYTLNFYNTLGDFVNKVDGVVDVAMIRRMQPDRQGHYTVRLYWWPVTANGRQAATGAYIMRGVLSGDGLDNPLLESSAHPLSLPKKSEKITATFGYLRRG